jgi:hypothetical protein
LKLVSKKLLGLQFHDVQLKMNRMLISRLTALLLSTGAFFLLPNASIASDTLPEPVKASMPEAKKLGNSKFTWFGLHVYDAQLWSSVAGNQFDYKQHPSWLELKYGRDFEGVDIAEQSREEMEKIGGNSEEKLKVWEKKLAEVFPNIKKGDTLSALYLPGKAMQFFHNGKPLAAVNDMELARSFMGIWLDSKTSEPDLRKKLIGLR